MSVIRKSNYTQILHLHFWFFLVLENFSIFFTILCVLCLVNALNLADGINGLALGIIITWLFYINQIYENNLSLLINIIFLNLFLILINNIRGKYFLGDSGSLMLSSFVALLIIYLHTKILICQTIAIVQKIF